MACFSSPKLPGKQHICCSSFFCFHFSCFFFSCEKDFSSLKNQPAGPDTTSHNFSWRIDTLGIGGSGSSYLLDVAIIDENDIWAVGEIHTPETDRFDSLGIWQPPFNAVHWNGQEWEYKRFFSQNPNGYSSYLVGSGIIAFSSNDIWIASGGVHKYNGQTIQSYWINNFPGNPNPILDEGQHVKKLWGSSSGNIYAAGKKGGLAHFDGAIWRKINSGTTVDIQDIWGARNDKTGKEEILAVASFGPQTYQDKMLLNISGTVVSTLNDSGLPLDLNSVWFVPNQVYYIAGDGLFTKSTLADSLWQDQTGHPLLYKNMVRGNGWNDVFVVGSYNLVSHFNGSTWKHYFGNLPPYNSALWSSVSVKKNLVVSVGISAMNYAIILTGKR